MSVIHDLFSKDVCNPGVKELGVWLKYPGKYHNKCGCPKGKDKCPKGYFSKFENLYDEQHNPIAASVVASGYSGKSCGEIAGKYPDDPKWNQSLFTKCVDFQKLQSGVSENLRELQPVHALYEDSKAEHFSVNQESSLYDTANGVPKRMISFNNQLNDKIKKDYNFLHGQSKSTSLLRRSNAEWKNMMDQMHQVDKDVTNQMQVKTRLAEINNEEARRKNHLILVIIGAFSSFFIALLAWVGYMSGRISMSTMMGMFVLSAIVFIIIAVGINTYVWKKFKRYSKKLQKEILHKGDKLNIDALQWVDENCNCPNDDKNKRKKNEQRDKSTDAYNKMMEHHKFNDDSIYYYDGTTKHKISPSDFAKETGYLPCDIQDEPALDVAGFTRNRNKLNNVVKELTK